MVFSYLNIALFALPLASAHIGLFHPAAFDFNGDGYTLVTPLSEKSFDEWWFHGNLNKPPAPDAPPVSLPAGGAVTVELACNKEHTSYGGAGDDQQSACPTDIPSYHAGNPIQDDHIMGCALAIAYKSDANAVQPEDFTVFSVNYDCVKQRKTTFEVPADMPACPAGGCVCSWFWQGQDSANEMYMTGFLCNVENGSNKAPPSTAAVPVWCDGGEGCVTGPKQPMYWANDRPNVQFSGDYNQKPSYNMKWGYTNGAQPIAGGNGTPSLPEQNPAPTASKVPAPSASGSPEEEDDEPPSSIELPDEYTPPENGDCAWPGHCAGASCTTYDDCSDVLTCNDGVCGSPKTYHRYMRYHRRN